MKSCTSFDLQIFCISLDADLNVVALSDVRTDGNPRRLTKRGKLSRNAWALRARVSSRCIARVAAGSVDYTRIKVLDCVLVD